MRGDDEEDPGDCQRDARDDGSGGSQLEAGDLCCGEPDPGEHDEQESDFRDVYARVMR